MTVQTWSAFFILPRIHLRAPVVRIPIPKKLWRTFGRGIGAITKILGAEAILDRSASESTGKLCCLSLTLLMYTAADPDPNAGGGGQLPSPKSAILR